MQGHSIIQCQQLVPEDLSYDYQGDALDFELSTGEVACIIGPSYSGKTHWFKAICGLENWLSGQLYIHGKNTSEFGKKDWRMARMKIAYLHADTALLSAANGLINVLAPAFYHKLDKKREDQLLAEKALNLLEEIDPNINLDDLPAYISKDHQYKIAVARALLLEPDVLALNNPFAHFNSDNKHQFQLFLDKQVKQGLSLLMMTHDIAYALSIADKIIFASRENTVYFDSKQAMFNCDIPVVNEYISLQKIPS